MDPLSITASSIAVLGALTTSGKGLSKLISLRHALEELHDLENEVEGLRLLLSQVRLGLLSIHGSQVYQDNEEVLTKMLADVHRPVEDFQALVEYQLQQIDIDSDSTSPRLRKGQWLRADSKIERHRRRIRDARENLIAVIGSLGIQLTWQTLRQQVLQIQSISLVSQDVRSLWSSTHAPSPPVCEDDGQQVSQQANQLFSSLAESSSRGERRSGTMSIGATDSADAVLSTGPDRSAPRPRRQTSLVRVTGTINGDEGETCPRLCRCRCHTPSHFETPRLLKNLLGHLVLSCSGSLRAAPCDYPLCRKRPKKSQFT